MNDAESERVAGLVEGSPVEPAPLLTTEVAAEAPSPVREKPLLIEAAMLVTRAPAELRQDFEHGISYWQPITLGIIAALAVVYIFEVRSGALASAEAIVEAGALKRENVLRGEVWRLFTAIFLHGGLEHLIGNILALYVLGMAVEHAYSRVGCITIFLGSGLAGSLLSLPSAKGRRWAPRARSSV